MITHIALVFNKKKRVGGNVPEDHYAEFDKKSTIEAIKKALESGGYWVTPLEADEHLPHRLKEKQPDIVFNIAEGLKGESRESYVPLLCERFNIPYTGSGPLTLAMCLNKARTKEILSQYDISIPRFQVFTTPNDELKPQMNYPLIVKPIAEGSSKGIRPDSVVDNINGLIERIRRINTIYKQPAIVEEFLPGREFTVSVLGNEHAHTLPLIEIYLEKYRKSRGIYSYEAKTRWEVDSRSGRPINLNRRRGQEITRQALKAHRILDCRDLSRVDIRLDREEKPHVLEVNPLPGLNPSIEEVSYMPKAARMAGMTYEDLINGILSHALERWGMN
jgi:D-alanine-D-alanine ligase